MPMPGISFLRGEKCRYCVGNISRLGSRSSFLDNTVKTNGPHLHFQISVLSAGKYAFKTMLVQPRMAEGVVD